jgi:hypothetical protein
MASSLFREPKMMGRLVGDEKDAFDAEADDKSASAPADGGGGGEDMTLFCALLTID